MRMSDNLRDFDKKNEASKNKTDLADEITQALGINGVYVSVSLTNEEMHLNELDFSAHDKVFEDKIAKREEAVGYYKDSFYKVEKNCDKLYDENESLKQRITELEQSRSEWIDNAVEWKRKCEMLESKETERPTKRTGVIVAKEINGQNYVTLDDFMRVINDFQAKIGT